MLNELIKGVSMKLNAVFGEQYKIYQNDVRQGLKRPCFFLAVLNPSVAPLLGRRLLSRNPLDVQFIPTDDANNAELYAVGWKLMQALEYIQLPDGGTLRGTSLNFEVVDGVAHCFVNYNFPLIKAAGQAPMEDMDITLHTKKG